jgi:hypothetical protein
MKNKCCRNLQDNNELSESTIGTVVTCETCGSKYRVTRYWYIDQLTNEQHEWIGLSTIVSYPHHDIDKQGRMSRFERSLEQMPISAQCRITELCCVVTNVAIMCLMFATGNNIAALIAASGALYLALIGAWP